MEISGVGVGATGQNYASALRAIERLGVSAIRASQPGFVAQGDSLGPMLRELSQTDLTRLLGILDLAPSVRAVELLRGAVRLAAQADPQAALQQLRQLIQSDPLLAETVASEPGLQPIRPAVAALLSQMGGAGKLNAESRLADTADKWDRVIAAGANLVKPEALFLVAAGLIDAGGVANCHRATLVCQLLMDDAKWIPVEIPVASNAPTWHFSLSGIGVIWLVLGLIAALIGWTRFSMGDLGLEVWIAGLLILSCFWIWLRNRP